MKKLIAMLLACVMVLGLVACGNTPAETTAAPEAGNDTPETTAPAAEGPEAITLKVWAPQEDQVDANSWLMQVEAQFQAAHPEYAITWDNGVSFRTYREMCDFHGIPYRRFQTRFYHGYSMRECLSGGFLPKRKRKESK